MKKLLQPLILVEAQVIDITDKKDGDVTGELKIIHVYHGSQELLGKNFEDISTTGIDFRGTMARPFFQKGEKGIWSLRKTGDLLHTTNMWDLLAFQDRARANHFRRYEQVKELAQAIEKVAKAKPAPFR